MTVVPELRGHTDRQNKQSVYIRITRDGKRKYKKTQLKVERSQWNGMVKNNHPHHELFNSIIKKLIFEYEFSSLTKSQYQDGDFHKYCYDCCNQWDRQKSQETLRQYKSEMNKLKSYAPALKLSSVTPEWLNIYKSFLFSQNLQANTVHKDLKFVRLIIRKAYKERLIEHNPFDIFEMPRYRDPEKEYLTVDQLKKVEKLLSGNVQEEIRYAAAWFCLGCYCAFRFGDMKKFDARRHIKNNMITIYTKKTGTPVAIPINAKIKMLLALVDYKPLRFTNVHYNRVLKAVGAIAEVGPLNAHKSRHTAAMRWTNAGVSMEVVSELLGHTSLKTTAIYSRISGMRIKDELKKVK